jgi:single-strand selective monofunctional uracil DNA glycosylase
VADLIRVARRLSRAASGLRFSPPVAFVYNPLEYAWEPHARYLERYGRGRRRVVWLGMNPGPFGMAQTGVPFGEVAAVRDWLGITGTVHKPQREHPKRPVLGFDCPRSEVSGQRIWGWVRERFTNPRRFFAHHFVHNYCPLVFMDEGGRNVTPDKLAARERDPLFGACDDALRAVAAELDPQVVIGVGAFAARRAELALSDRVRVVRVPHPSPASPSANRGFAAALDRALASQGVELP